MDDDPYTPYTEPPYPSSDFPGAHWQYEKGYKDQWKLIAEHVVEGGDLGDAPRPPLTQYGRGSNIHAIEGIFVAWNDARSAMESGAYDPHVVLESFADEAEAEVAHRLEQAEKRDTFARPDLATARRHTTIPRLFTDEVVHDMLGVEFRPSALLTKTLTLPEGSRLLGNKEHELWFDLSGLVVCETVVGGPDSSYGTCMKVTWEGTRPVVAAVDIGGVSGPHHRVGLGAPGAVWMLDDREVEQTLYSLDVPAIVSHPFYGESAWFFDSNKQLAYTLFLGVDAQDEPAALYFDATSVATYWVKDYYDDDSGDWEPVEAPWPDDAEEFRAPLL